MWINKKKEDFGIMDMEEVTDLRKLQMVELDILKKILLICKEYNIRNYMLGGTLLGAVRHKGFIPWDDDIDIGMPRPDYEKFIEIAKKILNAPYELQSAHQGNGHYYYVRIVDHRVKLLRKVGINDATINAWIDIFPLDGVPKNGLKRKCWNLCGTFAKNLFICSEFSYLAGKEEKSRSLIKRFVRWSCKEFRLEKIISTKYVCRLLDRILKSNDYETALSICNYCGYWGEREIFPKYIYDNSQMYQFEDIWLCGPTDYDFVCTQIYGDYMTPPAETDRNHHGIKLMG